MIYLLDTNAVSALMKGDSAMIDRLAQAEPANVRISQPVIAELAYGIERLPRSRRRAALQSRFDLVCSEIARADWSDDVSQEYGRIKAALERRGVRIEDFDAAIGAHAVALQGILVTRNLEHMKRIPGLVVETWTRA